MKSWINSRYLTQQMIEQLNEQFSQSYPFPHLVLDDFFLEDQLDEIIEALSEQEFQNRESDLFKFLQTLDFSDITSEILKLFLQFFKSNDFQIYLEKITGLNLSADVDMLGNIYADTDYLLCHDDKLPRRKLAYILYLTDLDPDDGGALHLFEHQNMQPTSIVTRVIPRYNRFVFFQVLPESFHEVGELINPEVYRVSINGWFNND